MSISWVRKLRYREVKIFIHNCTASRQWEFKPEDLISMLC